MLFVLKKWSINDRHHLTEICNNINRSYLLDNLPTPYRPSDARWWLKYTGFKDGKTGVFRAIIVENTYVGSISVVKKTGTFSKDADLGYFLMTPYWSRGIMTQAVQEICTLAFEQLDIVRISAMVFSPNIASRKVLEKNGFFVEGIKKDALFRNRKLYDLVLYGKIRNQSTDKN